ncbi:MAG: hypothetical protein HZA90_02320 [Verrucomicrobia bacterium]|nr:hypothetical protein [Verrucomicrobiota bacterium]
MFGLLHRDLEWEQSIGVALIHPHGQQTAASFEPVGDGGLAVGQHPTTARPHDEDLVRREASAVEGSCSHADGFEMPLAGWFP